ncbi:MAG: hypothetical protein H0W50_05290 [Parachlamydiaceae bacterium]|nr:hypothetical protein [Parachlamydiaceae bacterium]
MKVKVNNIMLSVPPYISTSWKYVEGLYMKGATLVVTLTGSESVNIPGISTEYIDMIFTAHAEYLEQEVIPRPFLSSNNEPSLQGLPFGLLGQGFPLTGADNAFQFGISSMDGLGNAMQHNPAHADAPDLPLEILQKIGAIVKIVAPEEIQTGTIAEQDCNCPYCQITRAINGDADVESQLFSEIAAWTDNQQQNSNEAQEIPGPWQIQETGKNQFLVIDKVDQTEFRVFLGNPVGCTCGQEGCEHIVAVLKS